jgi:hypothetical protein
VTLKYPFIIGSRLLPAIQVGGAEISIEYDGQTPDGRAVYRHTIDLPGSKRPAVIRDIRSGVGNATLRGGMSALLAFLYASATQSDMKGEFPRRVEEWAKQNTDEISIRELEIEETPDCCVEVA